MFGVSAGYPHGYHPHGHEELDASLAGGPKDVIQLHSPEELAHKGKVTLSFGIDNFRVAYLTLGLNPHRDCPHGHEQLEASLAGGPKDVIQLHSPEESAHKGKVTLSSGIDNFRVAYLT